MNQSPMLCFTSLAFVVEPGEDDATNPGIFGKTLAHWLAAQLREHGIPAGDVIPEDFGWCLGVGAKSERLYVACSSADGERARWRVFAFRDRGPLAGLFGRGAMTEPVTSLFATVKEILEASPQVQDLHEVGGL